MEFLITYIRAIGHSGIEKVTIAHNSIASCFIGVKIVSAAQRIRIAIIVLRLFQIFAHGRARVLRIQIDLVIHISLNEVRELGV